MRVIQALIVLFVLLGVNGCSSRNPRGSNNRSAKESGVRHSIARPVELLDRQGLYTIIKERKGKPLLLNVWATWCQPCVEEFPDLIKLAGSDTLVEIIGVSVDYPDELTTKVLPFLEKLNVPFKIYIAKFEKQEEFIAALDSTWNGAIPATFIYNERGEKHSSFIGQRTTEQFETQMRNVERGGISE